MKHRETVKYPFRANRRTVLKSATGAAAAMGAAGILGKSYTRALAQDSVRDQILQIPGPGLNPTDADMEKVGELCLTTENQGKFAGQTVRFQGLSNAGYHNNVFRPLSRAWEEATGAKIEWIDVTQADSYPKMAEAISSNAVDFDVLEGSGGWEGELLGGGFCVPMPDSIRNDPVYDFDDIVAYLQSPTRTWDGVVYGASVDGDMHHFNYRSDVFSDPGFAEEWTANGGEGDWGPPATWQQVQAASEFLSGKQLDGQDMYGILDVLARGGGVGSYFYFSRASSYAKHPDDPAFFFDPVDMTPKINSPAFVRALDDMIAAVPWAPPDQVNADLLKTLGDFLAGTGTMAHWWADIGSNVYTNTGSVVQDKVGFSILPGSPDVYNWSTKAWDTVTGTGAPGEMGPYNYAPYLAFLGWGLYTMKAAEERGVSDAAWDLIKHLTGKDISMWMMVYPSGMNPWRKSHFNAAEWTVAGYPEDYAKQYLDSILNSYEHPNRIIDLRIPGTGQYWILLEDAYTRAVTGEIDAQTALDDAAAQWQDLTDQLGRENQQKLYSASIG
ncbi:MAG: extracellular solute-binding protein [Thermomicrobiales bacterium]|nr:extracellular solute-binding protein [Thermomicrobiales bacterium]